MTVSSIVPVNNYTGNSYTKKFDFDFLIEDESELVVTYIDENEIPAVLTLDVDYSINEVGNENGSYIIFPLDTSSYGVLGENEKISLVLSLVIKQESEFSNSSYFNFDILEWTFDYIVRILQILSRQIERCIKVDEGLEYTSDEVVSILNEIKKVVLEAAETVEANTETSEKIKTYIDTLIEEFNVSYEDCLQTILAEGVGNKANIDLSNLSETGETHFLNKTQITNCVLELPNKINIEFNNGILTLKSGSIVIYPNGLDSDGNKVFEYYEIPSDISLSTAGSISTDFMLCLTSGRTGFGIMQMSGWYSGTSMPTLSTNEFWYDTSNNIIQSSTDTGSTWSGAYSLPFGIFERTSGTITGIKQIFNGIGVAGNVLWIDEGVKIVVPNGRNEDGSLNNNIKTQPSLVVYEGTNDGAEHNLILSVNSSTSKIAYRTPNISSLIFYQDTPPESNNSYQYWFDTMNNRWKYTADAGSSWTEYDWVGVIGTLTYGTNNITAFETSYLKPFQAVDKTELSRILEENAETFSDNGLYVTTYVSGTSGYRAWYSDEDKSTRVLLEQWGLSDDTKATVSFLKAFSNTNYNVICTPLLSDNSSLNAYVRSVSASSMVVDSYYQGSSLVHVEAPLFWRAIGK